MRDVRNTEGFLATVANALEAIERDPDRLKDVLVEAMWHAYQAGYSCADDELAS